MPHQPEQSDEASPTFDEETMGPEFWARVDRSRKGILSFQLTELPGADDLVTDDGGDTTGVGFWAGVDRGAARMRDLRLSELPRIEDVATADEAGPSGRRAGRCRRRRTTLAVCATAVGAVGLAAVLLRARHVGASAAAVAALLAGMSALGVATGMGQDRARRADCVAEGLSDWLRRLGVPPAALRVLSPEEHPQAVLEMIRIALLVVWTAYVEARHRDATLRLGLRLVGTGLGTVVIGAMGISLHHPAAWQQVGLGVSTCVAGYYLGAMQDRLDDTGVSLAGRRRSGPVVHRAILVAGLCALAGLGLWSGLRFRPPPPASWAATTAWIGLLVAALGAVIACAIGIFAITAFHHFSARQGERRLCLSRVITGATGFACLVYAVAHVLVAWKVAPTPQLRVAFLVTAVLALLTTRACLGDRWAYRRLVEWGPARLRLGRGGFDALLDVLAIRRQLAADDPATHLPHLADLLDRLVLWLRLQGREDEEVAAAREAVAIRRDVAGADPARRVELARTLHVYGARLSELGFGAAGLELAEEAVVIREDLVRADPTHRADLAQSLLLVAVQRFELEQPDSAFVAIQNAVALREDIARQHRVYGPDLAGSRHLAALVRQGQIPDEVTRSRLLVAATVAA